MSDEEVGESPRRQRVEHLPWPSKQCRADALFVEFSMPELAKLDRNLDELNYGRHPADRRHWRTSFANEMEAAIAAIGRVAKAIDYPVDLSTKVQGFDFDDFSEVKRLWDLIVAYAANLE